MEGKTECSYIQAAAVSAAVELGAVHGKKAFLYTTEGPCLCLREPAAMGGGPGGRVDFRTSSRAHIQAVIRPSAHDADGGPRINGRRR